MQNSLSTINHSLSTDLISNEIKFLIACCQTELTKDDIGFILSSLNTERLTLNTLISLANQHGIMPLVYKTLKKILENDSPSSSLNAQCLTLHTEILTELKAHYMSISQRNILMTAELIALDKEAKTLGIDLLPFKGPTLAQIAYGDITLRQFSDLDILIARKDFRKFVPTMLGRGYKPYFPIETFSGDKVMFNMNNDCPFYDIKRGLSVEIHWDFFRKLTIYTEDFAPWDKTESITINNYVFKTLSHENHLLYHALHGSKHVWERLGWIVDIDRFIRAVPSLDWEKVLKKAEIMGTQKMFLLGVTLGIRYFHTPVPQYISDLCKHSSLDPFITYVEAELNSDNHASKNSLVKLSKVIGLRDTIYHKTVTLLEFMFQPGINERRTVILPDKVFFLYWLIRPIGMGYRFIFCRLLHLCGSTN